MTDTPARPFPGPRAVRAAFLLAVFGWGMGFYGPPVFLHAIAEGRGWPVATVSAAVTLHFLAGAATTANLPALHRRFGLARVTLAGAALSALGATGWAVAASPALLFLATPLSGLGWGMTSGAAVNAVVAPWYARGRPRALSAAYNGASVGGVLFSPLWVALIEAFGFPMAAAVVGGAMVAVVGWLAARVLSVTPAAAGVFPDGDDAPPAARETGPPELPGRLLWRDRRFRSLAGASAIGLFAQVGLIAHLVSLLAPVLGAGGAGAAMGFATLCAVGGRTLVARSLAPGVDRRRAAAVSYGVQIAGVAVLLGAGGSGPAILLGVALFGFGIGNATSLPALVVQAEFAPGDGPRAVALVVACYQAAFALAPLAYGALREATGSGAALFVAAGVLQAVAVAVLLGGRRPA